MHKAELNTGQSFRRTSATMPVDGGGNVTRLKRHTGHKSTAVAEGHIHESLQNKIEIIHIITKAKKNYH